MPDTSEQNFDESGSSSHLEDGTVPTPGVGQAKFAHAAPMGTLPWTRQYTAALSALGVCVVLLALASFSTGLRPFSWILALASMGAMGFLAWLHLRQQAWLSQSARSENQHVNASIDALAGHLKIVANGDLSHPAPSAPGAMGRISQLLDDAFKLLAVQVSDLQESARRVEENAIDTTTATNALLEQAQQQAAQQEQVAAALHQIGQDASWVAEQSRQVSKNASSALGLSASSATAVSGMSSKIDEIRAAAVDAGTRVSRLGGFSKEMSSLVEVLARAADHAGVVALQASLQSEKAGAAGQGFRIVSESMKTLAQEIEALARRGSSITAAAASDIDASSNAVEQVIMGSDDVARLMDVAAESAQQSMEAGKDLDGILDDVSGRARACQARVNQLGSVAPPPTPDTRHARDVVALVASARELNQKMGKLRP